MCGVWCVGVLWSGGVGCLCECWVGGGVGMSDDIRSPIRVGMAKVAVGEVDSPVVDVPGVYDVRVAPFTDLRRAGLVTVGRRKVGRKGLDPTYADAVDRVITHLVGAHDATGAKVRVTDSWYTDLQILLRGTSAIEAFSEAQLCDVIDYGVGHHFWHAHLGTPYGLRRHAPKVFGSDEFVAWSLRHGRPAGNRPRSELIGSGTGGNGGSAAPRGRLAADVTKSADAYEGAL